MHCEVCGRDVVWGYLVEIEGARLLACADCADRGVVIRKVRDKGREAQTSGENANSEEKELVFAPDYGRRIRGARERLGVTVGDLAKRLRIPEGYLRRIEEEELTPTDDLARRLEKMLRISLFEEVEEEEGEHTTADSGLTLGDVVKIDWGKKQ